MCVVIKADFLQVEAIPDPSLPVEAILRRCNRLQVREAMLYAHEDNITLIHSGYGVLWHPRV